MPKYDVTMCYEKWQYYHIIIEADNEALATARAEALGTPTPAARIPTRFAIPLCAE